MYTEVPAIAVVGETTEEFRQACVRTFNKYLTLDSVNVSSTIEGRNYSMVQLQWQKMPEGRPNGMLQYKNEIYALSKNWVVDDEDVSLIKNYLNERFSAYHGFRLAEILPGTVVNDTIYRHIYARVLVPIYNSETEYIIYKNGQKHSMVYKVGYMYFWDCRDTPHHVINHSKTESRLVANFWIDLSKETLMKFQ